MFVKHDFNRKEFEFLLNLAEGNDTNTKALVKKLFRTYLSELMENSTHDQSAISRDNQ